MTGELERLAAACLLPGFDGVEAPDSLRRALAGGLGGVVLYAKNVRDPEQVAALTAALRAERADVLVATDEEGGDVTRLEAATGSSYPGNLALGVVDDAGLTERVGGAIGSELAAVGINLDFAPVADVNTNPANPIIGVRSFGSDPELVARHVVAFVRGMQACGVAACVKHFPGHGDTAEDSHLELPTAQGDLGAALAPFRAAIAAGVRAIMTAHIVVPELDDAPATLSRTILHGLLREQLGFAGVVVTDALEMRAVSATVGAEEAAVRSLEAGADALCLGHDLPLEPIRAAVVTALRSGRLAEERVREAAGRVAETGAWASHARVDGRAPDPAVGLEAARAALRAEGELPLARPALVVELLPEPSIAAGAARHGLAGSLGVETVAPAEALNGHAERQLVVVVRDAHRHEWQRDAVAGLLAGAPDAVVVETGLPVWRPGSVAYLATNGGGRANLEAAAERLRAPRA